MTDIYKEFNQRFASAWFSAGWVEVELPVQLPAELQVQSEKAEDSHAYRKNLQELQAELQALKSDIENISFKRLKLSNLAKLYQL